MIRTFSYAEIFHLFCGILHKIVDFQSYNQSWSVEIFAFNLIISILTSNRKFSYSNNSPAAISGPNTLRGSPVVSCHLSLSSRTNLVRLTSKCLRIFLQFSSIVEQLKIRLKVRRWLYTCSTKLFCWSNLTFLTSSARNAEAETKSYWRYPLTRVTLQPADRLNGYFWFFTLPMVQQLARLRRVHVFTCFESRCHNNRVEINSSRVLSCFFFWFLLGALSKHQQDPARTSTPRPISCARSPFSYTKMFTNNPSMFTK